MPYSIVSRILPTRPLDITPQRIVLIRPCCIGDVVMATGALTALRQTYPQAHITWAVGSWSARAIEAHPAIDAILDTENADLPVRSWGGFRQFVTQLRAGQFDLAVSLVRSPLMSLAVHLSGIPYRAGLDSLGRGFGYNIRVPIDPAVSQHEGDIYLNVIRTLAGNSVHAYANLPISESAQTTVQAILESAGISSPFIVAHAGGGSNPGMQMDSKRYPPAKLAQILNQIAGELSASVVLIGGPNDGVLVDAVYNQLQNVNAIQLVNQLSFAEIGALASLSVCYIGNDTGLTHLASASGAKTVMMMGPTDPTRYAPFTANHRVLWKPTALNIGGVAQADNRAWNWERDGFDVSFAVAEILEFVRE